VNEARNSENYCNLKKQFLYFYPARKKSSPPNFREHNDGEEKKKTSLYLLGQGYNPNRHEDRIEQKQ
jgi:hypothetical protein